MEVMNQNRFNRILALIVSGAISDTNLVEHSILVIAVGVP